MTLLQALRYFAREAALSLVRSWKVSSLAVLTISVSLFVSGVVFLATGNLARLVETWREQTKVVVYLDPGTFPGDLPPLRPILDGTPWVTAVSEVGPDAAEERFRRSFPSLAGLVEGWEEDPLPASLEVAFDPRSVPRDGSYEAWVEELRGLEGVDMVDDDRDWLAQLSALVTVVRGVGLALGGVLLAAAIFTIGSVIRLIAYLHHEEIAIMRIVGATEFYIRGPFYVEGMVQGTIGAVVALAALYGAHALLVARTGRSVWGSLLSAEFLTWQQQVLLLALGAAAGLVGAVASLRRESLEEGPAADEVA